MSRAERTKMNRRRLQVLTKPGGVTKQTYIDENTTMSGLIKQVSSLLNMRVDTISVLRGSGTSVISTTRDIADGDTVICATSKLSYSSASSRSGGQSQGFGGFLPSCCGKSRK